MKLRFSMIGSAVALSFALLPACSHESTNPPVQTTAGNIAAQPVRQNDIDQIATERCAREERCGNVGDQQTFASHDVCMMRTRADNMNELTNGQCPRGIDQNRLQKCLADIRAERCNNVIDKLSRVSSCSKDSLCP